jgi:8-oxo-dGTP pyrophosphatase MutT (NUDIX family)
MNEATQAWLASVYQPLSSHRIALEIQDQVVGSVSLDDAKWFAATIDGVEFDHETLSISPVCSPDSSAALGQMALALRSAGRLGKWRNEPLRVTNDSGDTLGFVERAAARALGIKTVAVHLMLYQGEQIWLQQRALDKATDPGLWDTCAGGLVAGADSFIATLHKETDEEAGLSITELIKSGGRLSYTGKVLSQRELPEGWLREDLLVWDLRLPKTVAIQPVNKDGEVAQFRLLDRKQVEQLIDARSLTLEAAISVRLSLLGSPSV